MTRTFIAIELNDAVRLALERQISVLATALPGVRFVDPAGLHLTLAFLGELDDAQVDAAIAASEAAASRARPFRLRVSGLGTFGSPRDPRVIWAGVGGDLDPLRALHGYLARELEQRSFPTESRPFSPHFTLARIKQPLGPGALSRLTMLLREPVDEGGRMRVDSLSAMASELRQRGAVYTRLRACRLAAGTNGPIPARAAGAESSGSDGPSSLQ
jgi:RNA 2',3'-cyclic 3'-phosphodiesterase